MHIHVYTNVNQFDIWYTAALYGKFVQKNG